MAVLTSCMEVREVVGANPARAPDGPEGVGWLRYPQRAELRTTRPGPCSYPGGASWRISPLVAGICRQAGVWGVTRSSLVSPP